MSRSDAAAKNHHDGTGNRYNGRHFRQQGHAQNNGQENRQCQPSSTMIDRSSVVDAAYQHKVWGIAPALRKIFGSIHEQTVTGRKYNLPDLLRYFFTGSIDGDNRGFVTSAEISIFDTATYQW